MSELKGFRPRRWALLAGAVGALVMLVINLAFRLATETPMLPELIESRLISLIPAPLFVALLNLFGNLAKPTFTYLLILGQIPLGALLGLALVYCWLRPSPRDVWLGSGELTDSPLWRRGLLGAALFAVLLWLIAVFIILPWGGAGVLAAGTGGQRWTVLAGLFLGQLVYAGVTYGAYRLLSSPIDLAWRSGGPSDPADRGADPERRRQLRWLALGGVVLVSGGLAARLLTELGRLATVTQAIQKGLGALPPEVTPTEDFYVVSKNFIDPTVEVNAWQLKVDGLVDHPYEITYQDILSMPSIDLYLTLECISNPVGGNLISNAHWRGVRLRDLLNRAGVQSGAVDLALYAVDDYSDSIRIEQALAPEPVLVYEMNGQPLTTKHGFPTRLLVPGIHGEKNVKWVNRMQVVDYDYKGYWQKQGWSDTAEIHTMSRIDVPRSRESLPGDGAFFGGIAFAGDRGIKQVQLSFDLGRTWHDAIVKRPLSPFTWVLWTYEWQNPEPGQYLAMVRAIDGTGAVQTQTEQDIFPDGATGYHQISVRVLPV